MESFQNTEIKHPKLRIVTQILLKRHSNHFQKKKKKHSYQTLFFFPVIIYNCLHGTQTQQAAAQSISTCQSVGIDHIEGLDALFYFFFCFFLQSKETCFPRFEILNPDLLYFSEYRGGFSRTKRLEGVYFTIKILFLNLIEFIVGGKWADWVINRLGV